MIRMNVSPGENPGHIFILEDGPMRRFKGICAIICLMMLMGCGDKDKKDEGSGGGFNMPGIKTETEEPVTEAVSTTEEVTEGTTEETTESATEAAIDDNLFSTDKALIISRKDMKEYLDGTWELVPRGQAIMNPEETPDILTFNSEMSEVTFMRGNDAEFITFDYELDDLFEEIPGTGNLIKLTGRDVTLGFSEYGDSMIGSYATYQIILVNNMNCDTLLLREIGNGESQFSYEGLNYERTANDGFWVFRSLNEEEPKMDRINNINEELRLKNSTFYAVSWFDMGDRVTLQRILINPEVLNLYGEDEEVISYTYPNSEYPLSAVTYYVKGMEDMAHSGRYIPGICKVTTDESGDITEMTPLVYDIFGYYYPAGVDPYAAGPGGDYQDPSGPDGTTGAPDGAGPDFRDPDYYRETDNIYMGEWVLKGDPLTTLFVAMDSPQVGGYELCFDFYRLTYADCYANISGSDLSTNQGTINNDRDFGGVLTQTEDGVRFTVTESGFEAIGVGTEYEFIRP